MTKFTAACLAILMLSTWFTVGCSMGFHTEKSTGPVTIQLSHGDRYQLLRPNKELFIMVFESPWVDLNVGDTFTNLVYYDDGNKRVFVKGEGYKEAPRASNTFNPCSISSTTTTGGGYIYSCGSGTIMTHEPLSADELKQYCEQQTITITN